MGNENKISLIYRLVRVIFKGKAQDVDLQIKCKGWLPINFASVVVAEKEKGWGEKEDKQSIDSGELELSRGCKNREWTERESRKLQIAKSKQTSFRSGLEIEEGESAYKFPQADKQDLLRSAWIVALLFISTQVQGIPERKNWISIDVVPKGP
jgi:hypothetical protein